MSMLEPPRIWWARPQKLCVLPRPGGGGRSHRTDRRAAEIAWMYAVGVRLVVSTMPTRHNLQAYENAGMQWHHVPIARATEGAEALRALLPFLNERLQQPGAIAIHADHWSDFPVAVCAAHLRESAGVDPVLSLRQACETGLTVTPDACALLGIPPEVALSNGATQAQPASSPAIAPAIGAPVATAGEPSSAVPAAAPAVVEAQPAVPGAAPAVVGAQPAEAGAAPVVAGAQIPGGSIPGQAPGIGSMDGAPAIVPVSSGPPAQPTVMPVGAIPSTPPVADTPPVHPGSSPGEPADAAQADAAQAEGVPPLPPPPDAPVPVPPVLSAPPPPASPLPGTGPSAVPPPGSEFPTEMPEMTDEPPANGISLILPGLLVSGGSNDGAVADAPPSEPTPAPDASESAPAPEERELTPAVEPSEPVAAPEEHEPTSTVEPSETAPLNETPEETPEEPPADVTPE